MAIEPYQPEPLPIAPMDAPVKDAARIVSRDRFCVGCGYNVRGLAIDASCPVCGRKILAKDPVMPAALPPPRPIDDEREVRRCEGCGYDLRGLPFGGVCPECGLPKSMPAGASFVDPLSRMPIEVIKWFRMACFGISAVMLIGIAVMVRTLLGAGQPVVLSSALLVIAAAWVGAVWLATPAMSERAGIARGFTAVSMLRLAARTLQLGWVVAAACALVIAKLPAPSAVPVEAFAALRWIGIAVGLAGVWCFAILMGRLAEWARDDFAERLFNLSLWGIPLGTPPLLFFNVGVVLGWSYTAMMIRGPLAVAIILLWFAWLLALLTFPVAMLSLTKSVTLSVMHNREHQERQRRQLARSIEYDERLAQTIEKLNAHPRN